MNSLRSICWLIVAAVAAVAVTTPTDAVPTFARRYETSCATCHQAFPRLNGVGESFRLSGFRFVDDDAVPQGRAGRDGRRGLQDGCGRRRCGRPISPATRRCRSSSASWSRSTSTAAGPRP